jgi:ABC-type nitrate/sulfonate/bicarbonate transport system substrate-binding protein
MLTILLLSLGAAAVAPLSAAPAPMTKIRYGLPTGTPVITTVGVYFAVEKGFFKQEGLDVEVLPHPGSTLVVRALLAKQVDIALTDPGSTFNALANSAPVKIISGPVDRGTDSVVAESSISSVRDLRGKRFAISDPGGQQHNQIRLLAGKAGINPDEIQFLAVGGPNDRAQALLLNRVQATSMTILILRPILDAIDSGKIKVIANLGQEFPDIPLAYNITRDDLTKEQSAALSRFLRAEIKGYRWAHQYPEQAALIANKYIPAVDPVVMSRGIRELSKAWGLNGGVSVNSVESAQKLLVQMGVLKQPMATKDVLVMQPVEQALSGIGQVTR